MLRTSFNFFVLVFFDLFPASKKSQQREESEEMPKKGGAGRDRAKGHKYSRGQRVQDDDEIEKRNAQISSEEEEEQEGEGESNKEVEEGSEEEESSDDDDEGTKERKPKGPSGLIQTANLNRDGPKKENLKLTDAAATAKPELSRRER